MLTTLKFVAMNLARRRLRSLVTIGGIAVAVAAVFSLMSFQRGYQQGLRADLDKLGAHLLVVPKGCPYDAASIALHGASWPCYLKSSYLETVSHTPHVSVAAPMLMSAVYQGDGAQVVYCGVQPNILALKRQWHIDGRMASTSGDILVGSDIAKSHGWKVGQSVELPGIAKTRGHISGVLAPTQGADDLFVYMPLADAQKDFSRPNELTHILVRLDDPELMDDVVANLRGCEAGMDMNVVPLAHLFHTIQGLIQSTRLLLLCVALVAVLAAGAGLGNTILMAVSERTREIGVLRAIGGTQAQIFRLVWLETIALCAIGGITGVAGSILAANGLDGWLRQTLPFAPHQALIEPHGDLMAISIAGALIVGTLACLVPALRAARLSPALSLRAVGGDV